MGRPIAGRLAAGTNGSEGVGSKEGRGTSRGEQAKHGEIRG